SRSEIRGFSRVVEVFRVTRYTAGAYSRVTPSLAYGAVLGYYFFRFLSAYWIWKEVNARTSSGKLTGQVDFRYSGIDGSPVEPGLTILLVLKNRREGCRQHCTQAS